MFAFCVSREAFFIARLGACVDGRPWPSRGLLEDAQGTGSAWRVQRAGKIRLENDDRRINCMDWGEPGSRKLLYFRLGVLFVPHGWTKRFVTTAGLSRLAERSPTCQASHASVWRISLCVTTKTTILKGCFFRIYMVGVEMYCLPRRLLFLVHPAILGFTENPMRRTKKKRACIQRTEHRKLCPGANKRCLFTSLHPREYPGWHKCVQAWKPLRVPLPLPSGVLA